MGFSDLTTFRMKLRVFALLLLISIMVITPSDCWRRRRRRRTPACQVSNWGAWTACSTSCGGGTKKRTRYKSQNGHSCPPLEERVSCKLHDCCAVSSWSAWGACSAKCGSGIEERTRSVTKYPSPGGTICPKLSEDRNCQIKPCPIDCEVGAWSQYSHCSKSCGHDSVKTRKRVITEESMHGGKKCPATTESVPCEIECPIDCTVSNWSIWGVCSATCDSGKQKRTRSIKIYPNHGGTSCPSLLENRGCQIRPCPIDCEMDNWSQYSHCSKSCGLEGVKTRKRVISKHPMHGGRACPATTDSLPCETECPIDCNVSTWSSWTTCSASCGKGTRTQQRNILVYPMYGGTLCPALHSTQVCDSGPCPVNCDVGSWSIFGPCSKTCGHGFKLRSREIVQDTKHGGDPCPELKDQDPCWSKECPVDCEVFDWGDYGSCDVTCGNGTKTRTRAVKIHPAHGGHLCPSLVERTSCFKLHCPVDCEVSAWGDYGSCDVTCGSGTKTRTRAVKTHPTHGGHSCPSLVERTSCFKLLCPVDCKVGAWTEWTQCKGKCGSEETQVRIRDIVDKPYDGGKACPTDMKEERACKTDPCPKNCKYGQWSKWSACSTTCGSGSKKRTRELTPPQHGGKKCWSGVQTKSCKIACPKCKVSDWSPWSTCEGGCKWTGREYRSREVTSNSANKTCPKLKQQKKCYLEC